jgi:pimeloyl-ACP methyl ester carboxylesterase
MRKGTVTIASSVSTQPPPHTRPRSQRADLGGWDAHWRTARALLDGSAQRDDYSAEERWDAWRRVRAPLLLVHGVESDVLTPPLVQQLLTARPETEVRHIEGAGHAVPLDQPESLADAVRSFL